MLKLVLRSGYKINVRESFDEYGEEINKDECDSKVVLTETHGKFVEILKNKIVAVRDEEITAINN